MDRKFTRGVHLVTALVSGAAVIFALFFQLNKSGPLGAISPFAEDPYDAVGSFAFQAVLLIGILTYARALRMLVDPAQAVKVQLVLRGNILVLAAILATLVADTLAVVLHPLPASFWGEALKLELWGMFGLAAGCALALLRVFKGEPVPASPRDLTPADAIDDLWILVRLPAGLFRPFLPVAWVRWVERFNSDGLFAQVAGLDPRRHPWRFACLLGAAAGAGLVLAQLREGLPPSLPIGLLAGGIFITVESAMVLAGFAAFGKYLGLRP